MYITYRHSIKPTLYYPSSKIFIMRIAKIHLWVSVYPSSRIQQVGGGPWVHQTGPWLHHYTTVKAAITYIAEHNYFNQLQILKSSQLQVQ